MGLQEKTEGIDLNRRLSMLILTCDDFISKTADEDVEEKVVQVLNRRFSWLNMTSADIQAAHRLQANNKVVVRFVKRRVRDAVYDGRFELFGKTRSGAGAGANLYIHHRKPDAQEPGNLLPTAGGKKTCKWRQGDVRFQPAWHGLLPTGEGWLQRSGTGSSAASAHPQRGAGRPSFPRLAT